MNHFLCMTKELNVTMHSGRPEGVGAPRRQEMT